MRPILSICMHQSSLCGYYFIFVVNAPVPAFTLAPSIDDESESGGGWLHPGVSPPGDAVLQLEDESNSVLESGCII